MQREIIPDTLLLRSFKLSTNLSNTIQGQQKTQVQQQQQQQESTQGRFFKSIGSEVLKQQTYGSKAESNQINIQKKVKTLESEVKSLPQFMKNQSEERTQQMIKRQKDGRRQRHINLINEFEDWTENTNRDLADQYMYIKEDINQFFTNSNQSIDITFDQLTNSVLLQKDIEFLEENQHFINTKFRERQDKLSDLLNRLNSLEIQRQKQLYSLCEKLEDGLIDIAFILEPEVKELVKEKLRVFEQKMQEHRQENEIYYSMTVRLEQDKFEQYKQLGDQRQQRWRELHHNEALRIFQVRLQQKQYTNPQERVQQYQELRMKQEQVFDMKLQILHGLDIVNLNNLSRGTVEKAIEKLKEINEKAQSIYDQCFEGLVQQQRYTQEQIMSILEQTRNRILQVKVQLPSDMTHEQIIREKCESVVNSLEKTSKELLSQSINFIEENDLKVHELCINICNFFLKIATQLDLLRKYQNTLTYKYEIQKATLADSNDDNLDKINQELESTKVQIQQAVHHLSLDQSLNKAFSILDNIENEYRMFHTLNTELAAAHPKSIHDMISLFQNISAYHFELYDQSKLSILHERNKKIAEEKVKKMIEEEELKKQEEELKAIEDAKQKKGGKPPPPKKVDPKKQAAEYEARFNQLMQQIGVEKIEKYETPLNQVYLQAYSTQEICLRFFEIHEEDEQQQIQKENFGEDQQQLTKNKGIASEPQLFSDTSKKSLETPERPKTPDLSVKHIPNVQIVDKLVSPKDPDGTQCLSERVFVEFDLVCKVFERFRSKLFEFLKQKCEEYIDEAKQEDRDFIDNSILILDNHLKAHYPLKGRIETEIYQLRASQITNHKKRYERHVRVVLERLDNQTQAANLIIDDAVACLQKFDEDQIKFREELPTADSLAKLDGLQAKSKDAQLKFNEASRDFSQRLQDLANNATNQLLALNADFLKQSSLFENGGTYSQEEVQWYEEMLKTINQQIEDQKVKRNELEQQIIKREFEKQFTSCVEELSAKNGTGKKYGRPRRLYQEKFAIETTRCETGQRGIDEQMKQLVSICEEYEQMEDSGVYYNQPQISLQIRSILMRLRTSIRRYSRHLSALRQDNKVTEMPRVTYNEQKQDIQLQQDEQEQDKQLIEEELYILGIGFQISTQQQEKTFSELVMQIEKLVKEEAQKIYTDKNSKLLTGTDKIPDYLRVYIQNMRRQAEEYRINSIRALRDICIQICDLAPNINQTVLDSVFRRYSYKLQLEYEQANSVFDTHKKHMEKLKEQYTQELRPNLKNPSNKHLLDSVIQNEKNRIQEYFDTIKKTKDTCHHIQLLNAEEFFKALLNNFEFLVTYYDNFILFEDFIKLPGDEEIAKKHSSLKVLMKRKISGIIVDTTTERALKKTWEGLRSDWFQLPTLTVFSDYISIQQQQNQENKEETQQNYTKDITTYKTYKQKTAYQIRNKLFQEKLKKYDEANKQIHEYFKLIYEEELRFEFSWQQKLQTFFNQ